MRNRGGRTGLGLLVWLAVPAVVLAHGFHAGTSEITVKQDQLEVLISLPAPDFFHFFDIELSDNSSVDEAGLRARLEELTRYVDSRFYVVWKDHQCERLDPYSFRLADKGHEALLAITARYGCVSAPTELKVVNRLLFERSGGMRHAVVVTSGGKSQQELFNAATDSHLFMVYQASPETQDFPLGRVVFSATTLLVLTGLFFWLKKRAADAALMNR